jgi:hypothetical protein
MTKPTNYHRKKSIKRKKNTRQKGGFLKFWELPMPRKTSTRGQHERYGHNHAPTRYQSGGGGIGKLTRQSQRRPVNTVPTHYQYYQ